ncbi:3-ketoacyl-CoA synthase 6-like [Salvia hispanica]|uniref:3-ketoacyl-CoA synthase 6-like n=1 Tax=Salvia hispanica TaxID=49212 RepID=UPI0020090447|nr:3-ketoacyl-CoA synthase 6-like [Salvia hispanica]
MDAPPPEPCQSAKLRHLKLYYFIVFLILPIMLSLTIKALHNHSIHNLKISSLHIAFFLVTISALTYYYFLMFRPRRSVYLIDYALCKPPRLLRVPTARFTEHSRLAFPTDPQSVHFQMKVLQRSGIGDETSMPHATHHIPPQQTMALASEEAELVVFSTMDSLLTKTSLNPLDIDVLVVNCGLFNPAPSLTASIINKYKLRSDIKSFNLSGMGCSAGLISLDLAKGLLECYPNINAVIISTEILTPFIYLGKDRSMLLTNCLFRMGCAAVLLSNRRPDRRRAKYKLLRAVRTHTGADDESYKCLSQGEDSQGIQGVRLGKDLVAVAGEALKLNIAKIGPHFLPPSEKFLFAISLIERKLCNSKSKAYVPDFKKAFEHLCIHPGGRAVIDELQKSLRLTNEQVEASRMTLHRFGNTSSSSVWYELSYIESKGRMKKGDRVWQIGFGSGFKCNSAVWECNRSIKLPVEGPWSDCIHRYPVYIPRLIKP